jgi:tetratricopeptide (TPR) repeat protein
LTDAGAEQHFQQAQDKHRAGRLGDAVNLYRDTLARDPRHLGALFNLAQISLRRGNPAEAESLLRRAIAITPAEPAFHVSLSAALRADGRPAEAKASAEQALKLRANLPDAWNNLALAAMDLGDAALAEQAFARLLALDQRHADGLIGLGSLRLQQGRLDEAEQALGNAIRLRPNHPLAYIRLGDVFTARGRLMPAVEAYRRARTLDAGNLEAAEKYDRALANSGGAEAVRAGLEQAVTREPNNAMAHELLGDFLSAHGFIDEAAQSFRRAAALDPANTGLLARVVQTCKIKAAGDPDLAALHSAYDRLPPQSLEREPLAFALGKAFDDIGEPLPAFDAYAEGNALKRRQIAYSLDADARHFTETARVFSAEFMARYRGKGHPSPAPIFIVGMPRSGTTLTEQLLGASASVYAAGELDFIRKAAIAVLGFEPFTGAGRFADPSVHPDFAALGHTYLSWLPDDARAAERVTDKMPANFRYLGLIRLAFPNARIVHVHRDPVDNCLSIYKARFAGNALGYGYDLSELGRYYNLYRGLMHHWNEVLVGEIFDLSYEGLVTEPEATSRRLFEFCGITWTPDVLQFHQSRREVRTASYAQVRRPINRNSVGAGDKYGERLDPLRAALAEYGD